MFDIVIIGAGIVGCTVARELALHGAFSESGTRVCVVERGYDVAPATSRANSGIVHAGFDATHGTLKARYNVAGSRMFPVLAQELGFALRVNGSIVCAFTDEEMANLLALLENGRANGVEGLRLISREELLALEPNANPAALGALLAPTGGIVNPYEAALAFAQDAAQHGVEFRFGCEVVGFSRAASGEWRICMRDVESGEESDIAAAVVVNAAGVYADKIAEMAGSRLPEITARRGEYVVLDRREGDAFAHTMFRAPSSAGKGVLVSPTVEGNIIVGPNAHAVDRFAGAVSASAAAADVSAPAIASASTAAASAVAPASSVSIQTGDLAFFDGPFADTTAEGIDEVLQKARNLWPELPERQVITRFAGLRATPENGDFTIGWAPDAPDFYNIAGIESPGLTAAPAIAVDAAADIAARLHGADSRLDTGTNPASTKNYPAPTPGAVYESRRPAFVRMSPEERARAAAADPAWGRIVCRCEQVTEAEIRAALREPVPALSLDAIKWRTRAGMGRCHGGFCSPLVAHIVAEETGCSLASVRKRDAFSQIAPTDGCVKCGPIPTGAAGSMGAAGSEVPTSAEVPTSSEAPTSSTSSVGSLQNKDTFEIAVIGGGAAGIAAALSAHASGIPADRIVLIDRESALGGILKQCIHPGFGLERYREELTGPEYAARDIADLAQSGIPVLSETTVTRFSQVGTPCDKATPAPMYALEAVGPQGARTICARSIVMATGSRERSAGQLTLDGMRPAGIYTAGCAQHFMNLKGLLVGRRVIVLGSGDIGLIMARRLAWEGAEVLACVVRGTRPSGLARNVKQCLVDNGIPILLSHSVTRVIGRGRVEGVEVCETDRVTKDPIPGTERIIACDTLLLSCGLIPEQDLLVEAGGAPLERGSECTTLPGVFLCGNASAIHDIVDNVTADAQRVGALAATYVLESDVANGEGEVPENCAPEGNVSASGDSFCSADSSSRSESADTAAPAVNQHPLSDRARARLERIAAGADAVRALPGAEEVTCICCPKGCTLVVAPFDNEGADADVAAAVVSIPASESAPAPAPALTPTSVLASSAKNERSFTVFEEFAIGGNECRRGLAYAVEEMTAPRRTLTTIVCCADRLEPLSVRTDATVLRSDIPACLARLRETVVEGPFSVGDVVVANICGTGANVVATQTKR